MSLPDSRRNVGDHTSGCRRRGAWGGGQAPGQGTAVLDSCWESDGAGVPCLVLYSCKIHVLEIQVFKWRPKRYILKN